MSNVFSYKISLWRTVLLPFWWHKTIVRYWYPGKTKTVKNLPKDIGIDFLNYSVQAAIYFFDRHFIDDAIKEVDINQLTANRQWQAYLDIGLALYDMGYRDEGIDYLDQSVKLERSLQKKTYTAQYLLCYRLNEKAYWDKRLEYAQSLNEQSPENISTKVILIKSYIAKKMFDEAKKIIQELANLDKGFEVLLADLYYEIGDIGLASSFYDKHRLGKGDDFWRVSFDYKKAVAYYKTNQTEKWQKQARKIGCRTAWDKFYQLDYLEREGIERIEEIDEVICLSSNKKPLFCVEKFILFVKRTPWIAWRIFLMYRYAVLYFLAGLVLVGMVLRLFLEYLMR
ncbi:MAG TPA: hypothetical protein HPP87_03215 [Planctomycetes bacterium]|nr:hypothetical protein [Planctomycetota bacterium]